ncbi:hypothetical protein MCUN1_002782 [Malassezia cuniculi]|uniref:Uncharacterized protein n=1 Tax=Malassezia cuniculi TaxID=948313 RepID=A0AAF0ES21_9BASI|nr:hypothetical protein MCUN1_002782 [Malassezia cuniculi]
MSLTPALRVPLGIPGQAQPASEAAAPWVVQQDTCATDTDAWPTDPAWAPHGEAPLTDRVVTVAAARGPYVTVYSQEVFTASRTGGKSHRRSAHVLTQALGQSPPSHGHMRILGSRTSSHSSASWRDHRWDTMQAATVGTTHTKVSHGASAESAIDAEDLLEKQYKAHTDAPVISHPEGVGYTAHAHVHARHTPRSPHATQATTVSGVYTDMQVEVSGAASEHFHETRAPPRAIRRLVTPDGSDIVRMLVSDGACELPDQVSLPHAYLFVLQASGRLSAWRLDTLIFVASTSIHLESDHAPGMAGTDYAMHPVAGRPGQKAHVLAGCAPHFFLVCCDGHRLHKLHALNVAGTCASGMLDADGALLSLCVSARDSVERSIYALGKDRKPISSERISLCEAAQKSGCDSGELVALRMGPDRALVGLSGTLLAIDTSGQAAHVTLPSALRTVRAAPDNRVLCICEEHLVLVDVSGQICVEHADVLEERQSAALAAFLLPDGHTGVVDGVPTAYVAPAPTAILPITMTRIVMAIDGGITTADMSQVLSGSSLSPTPGSKPSWNADITVLQHLGNPRTGTRYILGGSDRGDICVWNATTLALEADWSGFAAPLRHVVPLVGLPHTSRLYGCVLCVAEDSTAGLLLLDDPRLMQLFPGADMPLVCVAARNDELLLQYGKLVRIWNIQTQEMVQSLSEKDVNLSDWQTFVVPQSARGVPLDGGVPAGMLALSGAAPSAVSVLVADMRRCFESTTKTAKGVLGAAGVNAAIDGALDRIQTSEVQELRLIPQADPAAAKITGPVSVLQRVFLPHTAGDACQALLSGPPLHALVADGVAGFLSVATEALSDSEHLTTSAAAAQWLLAGTALVLLTSMIDGMHDASIAALQRLVEPSGRMCMPSLVVLAQHVVDENEVLRAAARLLFRPYCAAAEPESLMRLADKWAQQLGRNGIDAGALLVLGLVATERYAYMTPSLLKSVSHAIAQCISPRAPPEHAAVALELCATGFDVWQHYVDAVSLVRGIFELSADETATVPLRAAARRATLALAAQHGALFMSTLAMDILHPPTPHHNQVALRLVAFLVRHKPLALYPSLPRLAEAVVKSLDPTAARASMVQAATVMISELVNTYPSISFHRQSQRLAVGTHEGAVWYALLRFKRTYEAGDGMQLLP